MTEQAEGCRDSENSVEQHLLAGGQAGHCWQWGSVLF